VATPQKKAKGVKKIKLKSGKSKKKGAAAKSNAIKGGDTKQDDRRTECDNKRSYRSNNDD